MASERERNLSLDSKDPKKGTILGTDSCRTKHKPDNLV